MSSKIEMAELMDIVARVNEQLAAYVGDSDLWLDATITSDGYQHIVEFLGCVVYNSVDSCLRVDEDETDEPVEVYIVREINRVIQTLSGLKIWVYQ